MAAAKKLTAAILAKRASKGSRGKRTRPGPRQYTVADLERARDRVAAAERRIDNDHTSNPNRGRAGLERAQLELHIIASQLRLRGLLECRPRSSLPDRSRLYRTSERGPLSVTRCQASIWDWVVQSH